VALRAAVLVVVVISFVGLLNTHSARASGDLERSSEVRRVQAIGAAPILSSNTSSRIPARETAGPDTFALYGGPDHPTQGKFQLEEGVTPDWGGGNGLPWTGAAGEWTPVDITDQPVYWHRDQFNAQNLGTTQPSPNHAMWCGLPASDPRTAGWAAAPGYGNNWSDALLYESGSVLDPSSGQVVALDFYFHHDTEPGFDFFEVQYDSAGSWTTVLGLDGSNRDASNLFPAPGVQFSAVQGAPITFAGNDYGGEAGDQIRIRMQFTSDGAWSSEDGFWPTVAGAAQVDQITLTTSEGSFVEDYEEVRTPPATYLFQPDKSPFAGDFAEVYPRITDIDPCRDNGTPVVGFIDFGQPPRNGPGLGGDPSTGGSTSPGVSYGIPGDYVVNYNGGLSFGQAPLTNEIWSPEIFWDLPGADDDGVEISGAFIRFTAWVHLPLSNGIFFVWHVRSAPTGEAFGPWTDKNFVYYGGGVPAWGNPRYDVSGLLVAGPERVQMAMGVWDYASVFGFPGTAATPAPCFDNAAFYKYRAGGPAIAALGTALAQDGFPPSGSIDASTQASRDALDIPFDAAFSFAGQGFLVPGDSVLADVTSAIPGATVTDIRMVWALRTNPLFEDAIRSAPARALDVNVVAGPVGSVWTGEVIADSSRFDEGTVWPDRYFFDLPDADLIYPGDVLHYYIQATDSDGRVSTVPSNTDGFLDFSPTTTYSRLFSVRGLPSVQDAAGSQPRLLVWNDFGSRGGEASWVNAFQQIGYAEGVDFDSYTTRAPTSFLNNGLGTAGAHGASADQMVGYEHVFYFAGNLSTGLLSNGSNVGNNDFSNDIDLMEQWHALPGTRNCAYFGDYVVSALISDSAEGLAYVTGTMGVAFGDADVRDLIGGQTAPRVVPNSEGPYASIFATEYIAYGGCLLINQFDQIQPGSTGVAGHLFTDAQGIPIPEGPDPAVGGVASVISPTSSGLDVTVPHAQYVVYNPSGRATGLSARARLFAEILDLFGSAPGTSPVVQAPMARDPVLEIRPNPFNPSTRIQFRNTFGKTGAVKVFNLKGELVRTLHSGQFTRPDGFSAVWDGTDNSGASVASGVYVIRAVADGDAKSQKVALVK
jgi:hypothetical protein